MTGTYLAPDGIKWQFSRVRRSSDRSVVTAYRDTGMAVSPKLVWAAVFVTRFGVTFRGQESMSGSWVIVDTLPVRGPWLTDGEADVRYVLAASVADYGAGGYVSSSAADVITTTADPAGIDWGAADLPDPWWGISAPVGYFNAGSWNGRRSVGGFVQEIQRGWVSTADRIAYSDMTSDALSFQAITEPSRGDVWIQSEYLADRAGQPRWKMGNDWGGPVTQWHNMVMRTSRTVWPDGKVTEATAQGVQGEVHKWRLLFSTDVPAPFAPVITQPVAPAWMDTASPWSIVWAYRAGMAGAQTAVAIKRVQGATTEWWDAATATWESSEVVNPWTTQVMTFPTAAAPPAGSQWTMQVAARGTASLTLSPYSAAVEFDNSAPPTAAIAVEGRDAATGEVVELQPRVSITGVPVRPPITAWQVEVVRTSDAVVVAVGAGEGQSGSWMVAPPLADATAYTARARVQQTGGAWSPWAQQGFSTHVRLPDAPSVTASVAAHPTSGAPGVLVGASWPLGLFDWATPIRVRVQRAGDDGTWEDLALLGPMSGQRVLEVGDWLPPAGMQAYRVRAEVGMPGGGVLAAPWGQSTPVASPRSGGWLMPYGAPESALQVQLREDGERSVDLRIQAAAPLASSRWVLGRGVPTRPTGSAVAQVWSAAQEQSLVELLCSGRLLLLTYCAERNLDTGEIETPRRLWLEATGQVQTSRPSQGPHALRHVSWQFVVSAPPEE